MEKNMSNEPQFEELTAKEAKEFKKLLSKFLKSYSKKEDAVSDAEWLKKQFIEEMPEITEEQAEKMAEETIESICQYDDNLKAVNEAAKRGISKEQWLADQIAKASSGVSVIQHGEYLNSIDKALTNANAQMMRTVTTKAGEINRSFNLDGFIAEQHHVNTFNANAALHKSKFFAEVKVPEPGETYGKNSVDVVIRDATNPKATPVHQYQVKYGSDAKATIQLLRDHGEVTKYSNQQIVVPAEQVEEVQKAFPGKTVVSKIGGTEKVSITSNELTKEQAKELQLKVQNDGQQVKTDWNVFQTKELALQIGKNAGMMGLQAAAITTGFSLAAQVIEGEGIDVEETVGLALKTGADAGVKAATAGALKVASEKGIIRLIPAGTAMGTIANIVCVSIENIKILSKVATGEITMAQAMDQMGRTTVSMVYSLCWGAVGMGIGAAAITGLPLVAAGASVGLCAASLAWIPIVGPVVGGLIGGIIGSMAGSAFGKTVYDGLKTVGKGVANACKAGWNKVKAGASKVRNWLKS